MFIEEGGGVGHSCVPYNLKILRKNPRNNYEAYIFSQVCIDTFPLYMI